VSGRSEEEALEQAAARFGVDKSKITLTQDEDVLDTWFSSALFPFSVFGWPDNTADMKAFYPTSLLETGHDILFFWVARMVMCGFGLTDQLPFTKVYLHAMVRDAHGRKMSKSLGNTLDPIDVMEGITLEELNAKLLTGNLKDSEVAIASEGQKKDFPKGIPECGADALRFGLLAYTIQGRDVNLNVNKVAAYRNFCNKIWQATKFCLMNLGDDFVPTAGYVEENAASLSFIDKWILAQLNVCINTCNEQMKAYMFGAVVEALTAFWSKNDGSGCLCDNYIEMVKGVFKLDDSTEENKTKKMQSRNVLWTCLEVYLRLLHPLMPFVTEELYHRLPREEGPELIKSRVFSIMIAPYPQSVPQWDNPGLIAEMATLDTVFRSIRSMRNACNLTRERPVCYCKAGDPAERELLTAQVATLQVMGQTGELNITDMDAELPADLMSKVIRSDLVAYMTPPAIDHAAQLKKLTKDLQPRLKSTGQLRQKLGKAIDFDAKGLKKMQKNEKKLKQSCEKYGLAVGEVPAMFEALSSLLELSTSNPSDPAFEAAIAALGAAAQAKVRRPRLRPPCSMY
jgi:valyl-tRNA synthetase